MNRRQLLLPIPFAVGLFALNNLAVISGWLATPAGYVHLLYSNSNDYAIYMGWLRSSLERFLHPNFQGPWQTEPAVFQPLFVLIARTSRLLGIPMDWGLVATHFVLYLVGAYAVVAALRAFLPTGRERAAALIIMLLAVPIPSLLALPSLVLPLQQFGVPTLPGIGYFVWLTSDGFLRGISGSILVTSGTVLTVASFACLAAYMHTMRKRYLAGACLAAFACGLSHPYEPFLIAPAGSLALLLWRGSSWRRAVPEVAALGTACGLGIAPTAVLALTTPWVRDAAAITRWTPPNPAALLAGLGFPTILAVILLFTNRRMATPSDRLLQSWVVCTLIGIYVPFIPWTQHLLDGFHVGVALLLARQLAQDGWVRRVWSQHRALISAAVAAVAVFSVGALGVYYHQAWKDGRRTRPERLFSSLVPASDVVARDWLATHGAATDLVLAPKASAGWFSSVPMLTVAGNTLFSITFEEQANDSDEFYSGRMDSARADAFLADYGVRWVVLPDRSPAPRVLSRATERARIGVWTILEIAGNTPKPYPGRGR